MSAIEEPLFRCPRQEEVAAFNSTFSDIDSIHFTVDGTEEVSSPTLIVGHSKRETADAIVSHRSLRLMVFTCWISLMNEFTNQA